MLGRVPLREEFTVFPSQSGHAKTGQVAEEDLGESRRQDRAATGGKMASTHPHIFNSV